MLLQALIVISISAVVNGKRSSLEFGMLSGRRLIIGILSDPPYVKFEKQGEKLLNVEGFVIKIIEWMAEKYHFTYDFVVPPDRAYGARINGTWNGLVGMVIRGDIDIAATDLGITYLRSLFIDFTYPFSNDRMTLLVPYPRLDSTLMGVVKPFHYSVWIGIFTSLIVAAVILWGIRQAALANKTKERQPRIQQIFDLIWFLLRVLVNAQNENQLAPSAGILVAGWCLAAFILVQSYTSCLVSYLTTPKFIPFVSSMEELANTQELTFVIWKYTTLEPFFMDATTGSLAKLGNKLRAHPENLLKSYENLENLVANEHKTAPHLEFVIKTLLANDFKKTNQCRLSTANIYFYDAPCGFGLPKSSPLKSIFNSELVWLKEIGLMRHWIDSFLPKPNRCSSQLSSHKPPTAKTKLTLNFLSSAFILLGVGISSSITAFVYELLTRLWT